MKIIYNPIIQREPTLTYSPLVFLHKSIHVNMLLFLTK